MIGSFKAIFDANLAAICSARVNYLGFHSDFYGDCYGELYEMSRFLVTKSPINRIKI